MVMSLRYQSSLPNVPETLGEITGGVASVGVVLGSFRTVTRLLFERPTIIWLLTASKRIWLWVMPFDSVPMTVLSELAGALGVPTVPLAPSPYRANPALASGGLSHSVENTV